MKAFSCLRISPDPNLLRSSAKYYGRYYKINNVHSLKNMTKTSRKIVCPKKSFLYYLEILFWKPEKIKILCTFKNIKGLKFQALSSSKKERSSSNCQVPDNNLPMNASLFFHPLNAIETCINLHKFPLKWISVFGVKLFCCMKISK